MKQIDLDRIIDEIKKRGLTAYEMSKDLPLSEAGINKIINRNSSPRQSTLQILHNYLFSSDGDSEVGIKEETPPEEARFEDIVARKVLHEIGPLLNGNTEKLLKAVMNLHIELNQIKNAQAKTQETVDAIEQSLH